MAPPRVFISYAHEDHAWRDQLVEHLGGLRHQRGLVVWTDREIKAGQEWNAEIQRELDDAAIVVLILSSAFLNSEFCQKMELARAIERHKAGTTRVIPILARSCDWESLPITQLECRPKDEKGDLKTLASWPDADEPLAAIAKEIREIIDPKGLADAAAAFEHAPQPLHLPKRRRSFFVGRDKEKTTLAQRLAGGGRAAICAVAGMGGIGKTELALQVANAMGAAAFPDGILTVDLRGTPDATTTLPPLTPEAAMQDVLTQLDATTKPPDQPAALQQAYARTLAGKRLLLLLDNASEHEQVTPLVPPEPVALLVTSRHHITLPEGLTLDLDTLKSDDARSLLKEEIGEARALDDATLDRFAQLCGFLPVALLAIAGTIKTSRSRTPDQLLQRLEADRANGLTAALDRLRPSLDALDDDDPALARRLARLAVFTGDFSAEAAAHVWETDEDTAHDALDALLARSLLLLAASATESEPRFRLYDLIRQLAAERLDDDSRNARLRHATYFKDMLWRCDGLYKAGNDSILEALALFDRERAEIAAGQAWAAGHGPADEAAASLAADYPNAGAYVILLRFDSRSQIAWLESALAASRRLGDRRGEGAALGNLGNAWAALGETRKAIELYEQVLAIAREIGDRRGVGNALGSLGNAWHNLGETRKAIEHHEQRLAIAREIGDRRGVGNALGNLGNAWADLGETRKAIEHHEQHLAIAREIGDRRGEGNALGNLGLAWADLGDTKKAIENYEQNLAIAREIGDRRGEGSALGNLGNAWADLGEIRRAIEHHEQRLAIAREIGDRRGEGNALGNLGIAWARLGEASKSIELHEKNLAIAREIGDRRGESNALGNLGIAWVALRQPRKAIVHYEQALAISREIGNRRGEGGDLGNIALAREALGEKEAAIESHKAAYVIFRDLEDPNAAVAAAWLRKRGVDPDRL